MYCESVGYSEVKCNEQIEKLKLIEEKYGMPGYEDEQVDEADKDDESTAVSNNNKKTTATTTCILIRTGPNQSNNGYLTA